MQLTQKITGLKEVAHLYANYFFDLDGVLWKGNEAVPGSFEVLAYLRQHKKNLYFITNSSVRGRDQLINKFSKFGFHADISECFPSAYISVLYLRKKYPHVNRIMTFGTKGMANQFSAHGFDVQHVQQVEPVNEPIEIASKYLDLSVQAIVVGWDPQMTFSKQCLIGFHIQNGIKLFGTNPDKYTMIGNYKVPGAGSIIAGIETGFNTKAEIIGKPNTFIIEHIIETNGLKKSECIMIGDNRETDIPFGNNAGIATLCVLSGVTQQQEMEAEDKLKEKAIPTYYSKNLFQ